MPNFPRSITLLLTLNKSECSKFKDYIKSPYFNKLERLTMLFENIENLYIQNKSKYSEAILVKKNYGIYNKSKTRKLKYDLGILKNLFEDFIAIQTFNKNFFVKKTSLLEDFLYRSNGDFFNVQYKNLKKTLDNKKTDAEHFQYRYKVEALKANYELIYNDRRVGDVNYQILSNTIDKDFCTKKLIYSVLMHNRKNIASVEYEFGLKDLAVKYMSTNTDTKEPIINCLFCAYKILSGNEAKKNYEKLKKLLNKYRNVISSDILNILYVILNNSITKIFTNRKKYYSEFFDLFSTQLKLDFFRINGNISAQSLKNMVTACIELDKYNYLEKFLLENRNKIYPEVLAEDIFNFNFAKMLLYKGEVEKASEMIINVQIKDLYYKLALRRLEIMLCYEVDQIDRLEHLVGAFQVALIPQRSKHISDHRILTERNFINLFSEICRISFNPNSRKKDVEKLLQKINKAADVSDQKWLLMKGEALLRKKT